MSKSTFGSIRQRSSGRYQARYTGPDGVVYTAPATFVSKGHAGDWLADERVAISKGTWVSPALRDIPADEDPRDSLTFEDYATTWIAGRRSKSGEPLRPTTVSHYRDLQAGLAPTFGDRTIRSITRLDVRQWHATAYPTAPTMRAHAYGFLKTVLDSAVADEVITANPCQINGAGSVERKRPVTVLSDTEYILLSKSMPDQYRAMVTLATWCALRFGELAELRRADVDLIDDQTAVIRVRRGVTRSKGAVHRGRTKTDAGMRDITVPPHIVPALAEHLREHTGTAMTDLLFPAPRGGNLATATFYYAFYPARQAAGRPDLRFHDLRHTGAVLAAQAGATIADLMARLGHTTPTAAMRYQHTAAGRDALVAAEMSRRASMA